MGVLGAEAFTDVSKLVEVFGLEKVLTFSQWEDCRQISVSMILMSCDLTQPIRMEELDEKATEPQIHRQRDVLYTEGPHSVGVWTLKLKVFIYSLHTKHIAVSYLTNSCLIRI